MKIKIKRSSSPIKVTTGKEQNNININIQKKPSVKADGTDDISINSLNRYLDEDVTIENVKDGTRIRYDSAKNKFVDDPGNMDGGTF